MQTQGSRPGQTDESLSHALLDKFVEAGGNFIDTADVYQFGVSETIIGITDLYYSLS
jgi:aryl-alcohol dehydrogenase-like predicted oxidoreductase